MTQEERCARRKEFELAGRLAFRKIYLKGAAPAIDVLKNKKVGTVYKSLKTRKIRMDRAKNPRMHVIMLPDESHLTVTEWENDKGRNVLTSQWFRAGSTRQGINQLGAAGGQVLEMPEQGVVR